MGRVCGRGSGNARGDPVIHECPADGCDYSGELGSVCGHFGGKQDPEHKGSYQTAKAMLEASAEASGGGSQETQSDRDLEFPENNSSSGDPEPVTEPDRIGCPSCGSRNFASSELTLSAIPDLSDRARSALEAHTYHCHDCGEVFDL